MQLPLPLHPEPPVGSHKKVIYFVRHAEAEHNVVERKVVEAVVASGEMDKKKQDEARRAVLNQDPSLRDAPLSKDGTEQCRTSGKKLGALFHRTNVPSSIQHQYSASDDDDEYMAPLKEASTTTTPNMTRTNSSGNMRRSSTKEASPFRFPDVVLVSPLRRALMTATELFMHSRAEGDVPPRFLAIEALREKRTGMACDERSSVAEMKEAFPHVDFTDVERGVPHVDEGEQNPDVRARGEKFLDERLAAIPGQYLAIVSHKGWLREHRKVLKSRVEAGLIRADFDINEWDTKLYGNAEVRVAAFRWQDGELISVFSRSVDNAMLASATMMGDGFEFALGPPSSGFSIFLADRTTKVHFISLAEGRHNVAVKEAHDSSRHLDLENADEAYSSPLLRMDGESAKEHPLYDARLTRKGLRQAQKLRDMLSNRPSGGRPFTAFDLVVVSPLTRALETAREIFSKTPGTYGGEIVPPPRMEVSEDCRERYGRYVCDGRRSLSDLQLEFPMFDFSRMRYDPDVLHTDERETGIEVQARAIRLLESLSRRPERCIAVVTHTEFLRHLFGQFGDTLHEEDRTCLQRTAKNCELRSVVLCSHGAVEREGADALASTIRVPSSTSLSSLTALDETAEIVAEVAEHHALSFEEETEVPISF